MSTTPHSTPDDRPTPGGAHRTEADRIRSAGLDESGAPADEQNTDDGSATEAERIRSDGVDPE